MSHRQGNYIPLQIEVKKTFRQQLAAAERAKREGRPIPQVYAPRNRQRSNPEGHDSLFDESIGDRNGNEDHDYQDRSDDRVHQYIRRAEAPVETDNEQTNNIEVEEAVVVQSTSDSSGRLAPSSPSVEDPDQVLHGIVTGRRSWSGKRLPGQSIRLPGQEGHFGQKQPYEQAETHGEDHLCDQEDSLGQEGLLEQEGPLEQEESLGEEECHGQETSHQQEECHGERPSYQQDADALNERPRRARTPGTFPDDQDEEVPIATREPECERCKWMNERAGLANLRKEDIECSWTDAGVKSDGFAGSEYEWKIYYVKTRQHRDVPGHVNIWPPSMKDRVCKNRNAAEPIESPVVLKRRRIEVLHS